MDNLLLCIESSSNNCSVALFSDGQLLAHRSRRTEGFTHAKDLHVFVESVFETSGADKSKLKFVAVSSGPGSYTGLRIGVSEAKGLCMALDAQLIDLPTLEWMSAYWREASPDCEAYCCVADAGRSELYVELRQLQGEVVQPLHACIVDEEWVSTLNSNNMLVVGEGAFKLQPWNKGQLKIIEDYYPDALHMLVLAMQRIEQKQFADPIFFEPHYLKEFIPGRPKETKSL